MKERYSMDQSTLNLKTVWNGDKSGNGQIKAQYLETNIAIPESLGGIGNGAEPQELLVSSAVACYTMTLVGMLDGRDIPLSKIEIDTETVNSDDDGLTIKHLPTIHLPTDASEKQVATAERMIPAANKACDVGNILKKAGTQIEVEGEVTVQS